MIGETAIKEMHVSPAVVVRDDLFAQRLGTRGLGLRRQRALAVSFICELEQSLRLLLDLIEGPLASLDGQQLVTVGPRDDEVSIVQELDPHPHQADQGRRFFPIITSPLDQSLASGPHVTAGIISSL